MARDGLVSVAGFSFTKGKARFHAVNVSKNEYAKVLTKEGRTNARLLELPERLSRLDAAQYVAGQLTLNAEEKLELARVVKEKGKIRRLHRYTRVQTQDQPWPRGMDMIDNGGDPDVQFD